MQNTLLFTSFGFCFFISSCHSEVKVDDRFDYLTMVIVADQTLELYNQKERCSIRVNNSQKGELLDIPYPCGFVRVDKTAIAQTYHYNEKGHVFVVAGPIAEKEAYNKNSGVNFNHMCSNQGQAILFQDGKLILRKRQSVALGFCHHLGFDEKDYYGFAYPID